MQNYLLSNYISNVHMKKIKAKSSINSPSNKSSSSTNLINANQRFNNDTKFNLFRKKQISSKYSIPKTKIIRKIIITKSKNKITQGNQSEIQTRSKGKFHLPILSRDISKHKRNIYKNNNNDYSKHISIKKKILNKNKKHELLINPISLYFETSTLIMRKKDSKVKDKFLQRVKDYKQRLKEEFPEYKTKNNMSVNSTQYYIIDKENTNNFNDTCINVNNINNYNYQDLNKYIGSIRKSKILDIKRFVKMPKFKPNKYLLNDETKDDIFS